MKTFNEYQRSNPIVVIELPVEMAARIISCGAYALRRVQASDQHRDDVISIVSLCGQNLSPHMGTYDTIHVGAYHKVWWSFLYNHTINLPEWRVEFIADKVVRATLDQWMKSERKN